MDALLRRRAMIASGGGEPPVPPDLVPYIRNTVDAYIDTGITADNTVKVIIWARNFNPSAGTLFGSRLDVASKTFCIGAHGGGHTGRIRVDYNNTNNTYADDQFFNLSHYHKYEFYQGVLSVDDVTVASATTGTFSNGMNIHLFGVNNNGTHANMSLPADICACKIYKNGNLVRDYTPVNTPSVGLYDAVSDTVFTNSGTGSLIYGGFSESAYTPLEYITANGAQYFITSVIGTYELTINATFKPTGTTLVYFDIIGGRDATNRCQIFIGNNTYSCSRISAIFGTGAATDIYRNNRDGYVRNKVFTVVKTGNSIKAYNNYAQIGNAYTSSVDQSYSTGVPLAICASWLEQSQSFVNYFVGDIKHILLGGLNLVPAKVNDIAGMYDTYNEVFYPSITSMPFVEGPTI